MLSDMTSRSINVSEWVALRHQKLSIYLKPYHIIDLKKPKFEIICKEIEKLWITYKGVKCVNIPNFLSLHSILIFLELAYLNNVIRIMVNTIFFDYSHTCIDTWYNKTLKLFPKLPSASWHCKKLCTFP